MSLLTVSNLTTQFRTPEGWRSVVDDVSFSVDTGQTLAVVGESGSGKSVTALSVMGLLPQGLARASGSITFEGKELLDLPERQMERIRGNDIAMIFQEPMTSLNPVLSVGRQIAEPLMRHRGLSRRAAMAEAVRLMDRVRIPSAGRRAREYPHEMSGGMLQRVMIATALACAPRLLIADEPTTALDVTIQAQILELIKELQDEDGMGVLFITHDMGVVAEIAERTVVMYRSKLLEAGATDQIFDAPATDYTRRLLAAAPRLGALADSPLPRPFPAEDGALPAAVDTVQHDAPPLLEVRDLVTRFDLTQGVLGRVHARVHAVQNVSFDLQPGETLAVVGESGCGKSTTGRSVLRLTEPTSGSIRFDGQNLRTLPASKLVAERQAMQMIFQDPFSSLNPRMRVGDAIAEPMIVHGLQTKETAPAEVARLLDRVGLDAAMASRWPHEFSGGQRQRISIARALGLKPRLIVADESVSALDVTIKAQVVNLMMELQADLGLSYLFISHDMAVVERISHRVAVMLSGEIVEIGPRERIFSAPQHPYTRRLLAAVPEPDPARRLTRRKIEVTELKSPVKAPDYQPPVRSYAEVAPGHLVMQGD
ncbi:peptide/nickel transport system ATP-binding protein [Pseudooceanicola antarcticus]|uniref:Glutathione import ATP-binding protein GsiA n=1 Tax=Pseudooceanicola antarcticus TaxID=1247613 RepID=A0A285JCH8_9RHOB|nr:ABC transporter ATP-binding protein [Pseudooceanicola antarcticus]PJE30936.1 ABC transporter ATP-binding protein [Pseudooceanicola antarcticus]SNY57955.1 peptide/nickel transport system ATP-binding protein [Pseudooceanicola antarcticus]